MGGILSEVAISIMYFIHLHFHEIFFITKSGIFGVFLPLWLIFGILDNFWLLQKSLWSIVGQAVVRCDEWPLHAWFWAIVTIQGKKMTLQKVKSPLWHYVLFFTFCFVMTRLKGWPVWCWMVMPDYLTDFFFCRRLNSWSIYLAQNIPEDQVSVKSVQD